MAWTPWLRSKWGLDQINILILKFQVLSSPWPPGMVPEHWGQGQQEKALRGCGASLSAVGLFFSPFQRHPVPVPEHLHILHKRFKSMVVSSPWYLLPADGLLTQCSLWSQAASSLQQRGIKHIAALGTVCFCSLCAHWGAFRSLRLPKKFWIQKSHCWFGEGCRNNCLGAETDILAQLIWRQH